MEVVVWSLLGTRKTRHTICKPVGGFPRGTECLASRINGGRIIVLEFPNGTVVELDGTKTFLLATEYRVKLTGLRARLFRWSQAVAAWERALKDPAWALHAIQMVMETQAEYRRLARPDSEE